MIALGFDGLVPSSPTKEGFELQLNTEQRSLLVAGWWWGAGGRGTADFYRFGMKNVFN